MNDTPANIIVKRFGGVRKLARALGVEPSTVCRWRKPAAQGGTGGLIPSRQQVAIRAAADRLGIKLKPSEMVGSAADGQE